MDFLIETFRGGGYPRMYGGGGHTPEGVIFFRGPRFPPSKTQ